MSVDASIDLRIVDSNSSTIVSPIRTLKILINNGWRLSNNEGYVFYKLPYGEDEMLDWETSKMSTDSLMEILEQKEQRGELIGIRMVWQDTGIGGEVLLRREKEMLKRNINTSMSFCLTSDRKLLIDNDQLKITDVNWYLTKLLPAFNQDDTFVEYFTYEEHI